MAEQKNKSTSIDSDNLIIDTRCDVPLQMTNTGTIYVFENAASENGREFLLKAVGHTMKTDIEKEDRTTLQRKIPMTKGSRYGNALLNLGNWKGARSQAFAVGAPFEENGEGAVYVYSGNSNFGLHGNLPLMVIETEIKHRSLLCYSARYE